MESLRWFRNSVSVSLPWDQITKMSSTYLNEHTGLYVVYSSANTFFSLIPSNHNMNQQNWLQMLRAPIYACKIASNMGLHCLPMWSYIILNPHVAYAYTTFPQSCLWKYCMKKEINLRGNSKQCWSRDRRCVYAAVWLSFRLSRSNMDVALFVSTCSCNILHQSLEMIMEMTWCGSKLKKKGYFEMKT